MAILTPSLTKLRSGVNKVAPNRDKSSDGWIGDQAHASGTSGHNPDESGRAERQDADNIDEVRAADLDKDLRQPGLTMQMIVKKTLDTARDRKRLIYIIWNATIWSASNGWKPRTYTGKNKHTQHAHVSGHPAYDNDTAPWGIEELIDVALTEAQTREQAMLGTYDALEMAANPDDPTGRQLAGFFRTILQPVRDDVAGVDEATVAALATMPTDDLADILRRGMTPERVAELAAELATPAG